MAEMHPSPRTNARPAAGAGTFVLLLDAEGVDFFGSFVCVKTNRTVAPLKQGTRAQVPQAEQVSQLQ